MKWVQHHFKNQDSLWLWCNKQDPSVLIDMILSQHFCYYLLKVFVYFGIQKGDVLSLKTRIGTWCLSPLLLRFLRLQMTTEVLQDPQSVQNLTVLPVSREYNVTMSYCSFFFFFLILLHPLAFAKFMFSNRNKNVQWQLNLYLNWNHWEYVYSHSNFRG